MLLRALLLCALLTGGAVGLVFSAWQQWQLDPLLRAAEEYELPVAGGEAHTHAGHEHGPAIPVPVTTVLANGLVWSVFALFLLTLMTLHTYTGRPPPKPSHGILWGLALLACISIAPWLAGLPPEIPGVERSPVAERQLWWGFSALATAGGIALLYYAKHPLRWGGLILIALPHLLPFRPAPGQFINPDPEAQAILTDIATQFALMSGLGMLLFCLALGPACAWLTRRHLAPLVRSG